MKYWKAPFAGLDYVLTWPSATSLVSVGQVAAIWVKAPLQPMALTLQESKLFSRVRKHPAANASGSDVFVCTRVFFLSRFHDLDVLLFLHVKCQHVATWCFQCLQFCHPRCWKNITYKALLRVCILFWSLAKPAQDTLLWAMQTGGGYHDDGDSDCSESSDGESRKAGGQVSWCIDGVQICRRAFQRMLGLGCGRLNRTRGRFQGMDERHLKVQDRGARAAESSASVNAFMYKMYYSVGESMPTGWLDSFLFCSILFVRFANEFCCHFFLILFLIIKYFLLMVILFSGFSRIQWILGTKLPVKKWWRSYWTMLCLALQPVSANNWIRQSWANESCHRAIGDSCFWFIKRIVWQAILNAQVGQHFTIAQNHGELHFVSGRCQSIAFVIRVIWSNQRWGTLATSWAMHPLRTNF